jgi:hypothetical protein
VYLLLDQAFTKFQIIAFAIGDFFASGVQLLDSSRVPCWLAPAIITLLSSAVFFFLVRQYPNHWTAKYQILLAGILHLLLLVGLEHQNINTLVIVALVMVSFDMFQRTLEWDLNAKTVDKSILSSRTPSATETPMTRTRSVHPGLASPDFQNSPIGTSDCQIVADSAPGASDYQSTVVDPREEIVRLRGALTDLKTANRAKEVLLCRTKEELKTARETLNGTFAEYCSLRDEMKNVKQNMTRDHQAVVYRKDIELFALRKGNEQKEKYIKEHDTKLEEVFQQQKATVELKDAQLKMLKERLESISRQSNPRFGHDYEEPKEGDHALEVRLLKVKKAARHSEDNHLVTSDAQSVEEKDVIIASLREQLVVTRKAADEVVNQQAELSRAWEVVKKVQATLKEERRLHTLSREQSQELAAKLDEEQQRSRLNPISRLPTIEEDKDELEAMFDKAQEDNLRLYVELEALENRLRDANSRMFNAEQEANALRQQMQLEKATTNRSGTARPSVVHHVHFQRMEGQLEEVISHAIRSPLTPTLPLTHVVLLESNCARSKG